MLLTATALMLGAALYPVSDRINARAAAVQGRFPAVAVATGLIALGQIV